MELLKKIKEALDFKDKVTAEVVRNQTKYGNLGKSGVIREVLTDIKGKIKGSSYGYATSCTYRIYRIEEEAMSEIMKTLTEQGFKIQRAKLNEIFPELKEDETDYLFISWA